MQSVLSARSAFTLIAAASLVAVTLIGPAHAGLGGWCDDHADTDVDRLTECLEIALGTSSLIQDTDGDGIPDGRDLVPQASAGEAAVEVKVIKLWETTKKCDVKYARYWDPFVSTGLITIPLQSDNEEQGWGVFDTTRFTEENHGHDAKTITPESLIATLIIPEDIDLYVRGNLLDVPMFNLRVGLTDHDVATDHGISMGTGTGGVPLPISNTPDGDPARVTYRGSSATCAGAIQVQITSEIAYDDLVTSILASARLGSGENGAASLSDLTEKTGEATDVDIDTNALIGPDLEFAWAHLEQAETFASDADGYADPTLASEHTAWHYLPRPHVSTLSGWLSSAPETYETGQQLSVVVRDGAGNALGNSSVIPASADELYLPPIALKRPQDAATMEVVFLQNGGITDARSYTFSRAFPEKPTPREALVIVDDANLVEGWSDGWLWSHL